MVGNHELNALRNDPEKRRPGEGWWYVARRPCVSARRLDHSEEQSQMGNPVKVLTSGAERVAPQSFYASDKWRMVERVRWWEKYQDVPVVVGHYWRRYDPGKRAELVLAGCDRGGLRRAIHGDRLERHDCRNASHERAHSAPGSACNSIASPSILRSRVNELSSR